MAQKAQSVLLLALACFCGVLTGCFVEFVWEATAVNVGLRMAAVLVAMLVTVSLLFATLLRSGITFGRVEIPCSMVCCSQIFVLIVLGSVVCQESMQGAQAGNAVTTFTVATCVLINVVLIINVRWVAPILGLVYLISSDPWTQGVASAAALVIFGGAVCSTGYMPYLRDQRLTALTALCILNFTILGPHLMRMHPATADNPYVTFSCVCNVIFFYLIILFARRRRVLPRPLRNCKFVRLGYLRTMLLAGSPIVRSQEMPEEAFGDVEKAAYVIITSHRWLNRWSCDVPTAEFSSGLRLTTMVRRLGEFFPESCVDACGHGTLSFLMSIWKGVVHGGSDVLLFFDFCGLPQIGRTTGGGQILRTEEGATLFNEALPSMGALYTMYPVLVLMEVTEDVHPYFSSGWCSSEFYSAMLSKQLGQFSAETVTAFIQWLSKGDGASGAQISPHTIESINTGTLSLSAINDFNTVFEKELTTKTFLNESDRPVVRGIVQGYLCQRLLADAVTKQDLAGVQEALDQLRGINLQETLAHPVDDSLDTLLHRAVRLPSIEIVQALVHAGADPSALNLKGDTPSQFFALPRMTAAARFCRSQQDKAVNRYVAI